MGLSQECLHFSPTTGSEGSQGTLGNNFWNMTQHSSIFSGRRHHSRQRGHSEPPLAPSPSRQGGLVVIADLGLQLLGDIAYQHSQQLLLQGLTA